jgi:hypothetical protein
MFNRIEATSIMKEITMAPFSIFARISSNRLSKAIISLTFYRLFFPSLVLPMAT